MSSLFDQVIDRTDTASVKYDLRQAKFGNGNAIPLWVADMDFPAPACVQAALRARMEHPIFGYTLASDALYEAIVAWQERQHGWAVRKEWIEILPGVVPSLTYAVLALTEPDDAIVVQPPVYFPFFDVIAGSGRRVVRNPLKLEGGRYTMDFEHLSAVLDDSVKMLVLCSPHNPGGSVWTDAELARLAELCAARGVLLVSDEIHADLVFPGARHIPTASVSQDLADLTVTLSSAGKTFNIPGLNTSYGIIANDHLRARFQSFVQKNHLYGANLLGMEATRAAYTGGEEWLAELLSYLAGNVREVVETCAASGLPIRAWMPQATYLVWLDFRALGMDDEALHQHLIHQAGVVLSPGVQFGTEGSGFMRLNAAVPREVLRQALAQMVASFQGGLK